MRHELGVGACAVGALLMVAGVLGYAWDWVFLASGSAAGLFGLLSLGGRGSVLILLLGGWLLISPFVGWAAAQWNLLAAGIALLAVGFLAAAVGARAPATEEVEEFEE